MLFPDPVSLARRNWRGSSDACATRCLMAKPCIGVGRASSPSASWHDVAKPGRSGGDVNRVARLDRSERSEGSRSTSNAEIGLWARLRTTGGCGCISARSSCTVLLGLRGFSQGSRSSSSRARSNRCPPPNRSRPAPRSSYARRAMYRSGRLWTGRSSSSMSVRPSTPPLRAAGVRAASGCGTLSRTKSGRGGARARRPLEEGDLGSEGAISILAVVRPVERGVRSEASFLREPVVYEHGRMDEGVVGRTRLGGFQAKAGPFLLRLRAGRRGCVQ